MADLADINRNQINHPVSGFIRHSGCSRPGFLAGDFCSGVEGWIRASFLTEAFSASKRCAFAFLAAAHSSAACFTARHLALAFLTSACS